MKKSELRKLVKEEIKNIMEAPKPSDSVMSDFKKFLASYKKQSPGVFSQKSNETIKFQGWNFNLVKVNNKWKLDSITK